MKTGAVKVMTKVLMGLGLSLALVVTTWAMGGGTALAQPTWHVVIGDATLDGAPAANASIAALVDSAVCGTTTADAQGHFVLTIDEAGQMGSDVDTPAACIVGATATFTVDGVGCTETLVLELGGDTRDYDLTCVTPPAATPTPTPAPATPTPTPAATPEPGATPTATPVEATATPAPVAITAPVPSGSGQADGGLSVWWLAALAMGLLMTTGGVAVWRTARRRQQ